MPDDPTRSKGHGRVRGSAVKLAIVRQKYTPFGGAERFVERALASLKAQHVDVDIIARQWATPTAASTPSPQEAPSAGRCVNPFYIGRTWRDWSFARGVQKIIASGEYDLVQSHERIPGCHIYRAGDGVHATWLALRAALRNPLSRLTERLSPWHRYTLRAEAAMFRHPNLKAVICNSHMVRDDIAQRFGIPLEKLPVIYNGVDLEHFHPRLRATHREAMRAKVGAGEAPALQGGRAKNALLAVADGDTVPIVLFVGSGFERKGLPGLLDAFALLSASSAQLWVVGHDKSALAMQKKAEQLGLAERVRFWGPQKDVRPFYGAADIFALPTLYDPFPNAALEALACGLPLITTTTCGAAELVTADNGLVVDAHHPESLAAAINTLCEPGRAAAMQTAARSSVLTLDLASMAEKLTTLYTRILQEKAAR
ncbi:MAG: glycosyltransferase family 4 protein [Rugosibacter sp.]|nr:glycosyltransferase family 4 protein [Rugosibacter sp.]